MAAGDALLEGQTNHWVSGAVATYEQTTIPQQPPRICCNRHTQLVLLTLTTAGGMRGSTDYSCMYTRVRVYTRQITPSTCSHNLQLIWGGSHLGSSQLLLVRGAPQLCHACRWGASGLVCSQLLSLLLVTLTPAHTHLPCTVTNRRIIPTACLLPQTPAS
jgi:hypothetical protein